MIRLTIRIGKPRIGVGFRSVLAETHEQRGADLHVFAPNGTEAIYRGSKVVGTAQPDAPKPDPAISLAAKKAEEEKVNARRSAAMRARLALRSEARRLRRETAR